MRLGDDAAGQAPAGVVVMALRAGEIELAAPLGIQRRPAGEGRRQAWILRRGHRRAARLVGDEGGQRQQGLAFPRQRAGAAGRAMRDDPPGQVDGRARRPIPGRIARRHPAHRRRIAMASGTALRPKRLALQHPQHAGIGAVIGLHRLGIARHVREAGTAFTLLPLRQGR